MKRIVAAAILLASSVARAQFAPQVWTSDQDGDGVYACMDVAYFQAVNLAGAGNRCLEADASGKVVIAGSGVACGAGGGGVSSVTGTAAHISASPTTGAVIVDLIATSVTPGSYTYATFTVDADGRLTAASSGTAPVTTVTGTAQHVSVTPTTGTPVVDTIGGYSTGAVTGGNVSMGALASGIDVQTTTAGVAAPATYAPTTGRIEVGKTTSPFLQDYADWSWDDANTRLSAGTATPATNAIAHFERSLNSDLEYVISNPNAGGSAFTALRLSRDASPTITDSLLFGETGTNYLSCGQVGLLACKGALFELEDSGNFGFSEYGVGDFIFTTTTGRTPRFYIRNGGNLEVAVMAAPGTPAAGELAMWGDSTSKNWAVKNDAGTVNHGVQTVSCGSNTWVRAVSDAGLPACTQPAFTDVSGSIACSQLPAFTGDTTKASGSCTTITSALTDAAGAGSSHATTGSWGVSKLLQTDAGGAITAGAALCSQMPAFTGAFTSPGASCATSYAGLPAATDVLVSAGPTSIPVGDSSFTFDTTAHVLAGGNAVGVNGASVPTNASFVCGHTTNADRDRVQFNVGGGALGATGTGDNTFVDMSPAATTVRAGVTNGIYATERIRSLTYTGASSPTIREAASLYVDDAPALSGVSTVDSLGKYAIFSAAGNNRFVGTVIADTVATFGGAKQMVVADASGTLSLGGTPANTAPFDYVVTYGGPNFIVDLPPLAFTGANPDFWFRPDSGFNSAVGGPANFATQGQVWDIDTAGTYGTISLNAYVYQCAITTTGGTNDFTITVTKNGINTTVAVVASCPGAGTLNTNYTASGSVGFTATDRLGIRGTVTNTGVYNSGALRATVHVRLSP